MTTINLKLEKKHIFAILISLTVFGLIIRIVSAYKAVHYFDISYYYTWAEDVFKNGIFGAYKSMQGETLGIDYPPIILFPLYITGALLNQDFSTAFEGNLMLVLKMWQFMFDAALVPALYFILKRKNVFFALLASAFWSVNPAAIYNSSVWGQTDSIMMFMLIICLAAIESKKPVAAGILYALCCLTKFQCAYFAPVYILFLLFDKYPPKKIMLSLVSAASTAIIVFAPFMIASKDILLPFKVYFGGLGKWPYASLYSFNFLGGFATNYVPDNQPFFLFFTYGSFGNMMTVLAAAATVLIFFTAKRKCPYLLSFFIMDTIFMFSSRMHERYQIPVLILLVAAAASHKSFKLFICFCLNSLMIFANHFAAFEEIVYRDSNPAPWMENIESILVAGSWINFIVYIISMLFVFECLYQKNFSLTFIKRRKTNAQGI